MYFIYIYIYVPKKADWGRASKPVLDKHWGLPGGDRDRPAVSPGDNKCILSN